MLLTKKLMAVFSLLLVSACMTAGPESVSDVHTQTYAGKSQEYVSARSAKGVVYAQAYAGSSVGKSVYGLNIRRNAGFSNWAHYKQAFSFGQQMPFAPGNSKVLTCAPFGCDVVEYGQIVLTAAQFNNSLANGMELRLVGSGDSTVITVPAEAFRQASANIPR